MAAAVSSSETWRARRAPRLRHSHGTVQMARALRRAAAAVVACTSTAAALVGSLAFVGSAPQSMVTRPWCHAPASVSSVAGVKVAMRKAAVSSCPLSPTDDTSGLEAAEAVRLVDVALSVDVVQAALSEGKPLVVDFMTPRCTGCARMSEVMDAFGDYFRGRVNVVKVNVQQHTRFPEQLGFRRVPAVFLFDAGTGLAVDSFIGSQAHPLAILESIEQKLLA